MKLQQKEWTLKNVSDASYYQKKDLITFHLKSANSFSDQIAFFFSSDYELSNVHIKFNIQVSHRQTKVHMPYYFLHFDGRVHSRDEEYSFADNNFQDDENWACQRSQGAVKFCEDCTKLNLVGICETGEDAKSSMNMCKIPVWDWENEVLSWRVWSLIVDYTVEPIMIILVQFNWSSFVLDTLRPSNCCIIFRESTSITKYVFVI